MPTVLEDVSTTDIFYMSEFENSIYNDDDYDSKIGENSAEQNTPSEAEPGKNKCPKWPCKCKSCCKQCCKCCSKCCCKCCSKCWQRNKHVYLPVLVILGITFVVITVVVVLNINRIMRL